MEGQSDEEMNDNIIYQTGTDDITEFLNNYEEVKATYITRPYLTKFEKSKVLYERAQQISNGSVPFLKNPESYDSVYEIAFQELRQNKIPFIVRRPVSNGYEYWKLSDLYIL